MNAAELLNDAVVRYGLADQERERLRPSDRNLRVAAEASQRQTRTQS